MTDKFEAVLEGTTFYGFDDNGKRCIYGCNDIVSLTRTQIEAFGDQFKLVEESEERTEDPPPPPEDDPPGQGHGHGHGHDDDDDEEEEDD